MKRTLGADIGYSSGKNSSSLNIPPSYGDYSDTKQTQQIKK